jgi:hypothetical protein
MSEHIEEVRCGPPKRCCQLPTLSLCVVRKAHCPLCSLSLQLQREATVYALSKVNYMGVNSTNLAQIVAQGPSFFNRSESIFNMYEVFKVRSRIWHICSTCTVLHVEPVVP